MPDRTYRTCLLALASAVVLPLPALAARTSATVRDASGTAAGAYPAHSKRHSRRVHGRAAHRRRPMVRHHAVLFHAAGDPGVRIADFQFTAATTTIQVGDTVTWTNSGPSDHTATAYNGSFDTAALHRGQSASHTFTQAGTITYFCRIHPFMKGTVVVLAAAGASAAPGATGAGAGTGSGSGSGSGAGAPTTAGTSGPTLPFTGLDVGTGVGVGLLLLAIGLGLRRAVGE